MKKMSQGKIWRVLGSLLLVLPLLVGVLVPEVSFASETQKVTLHKRALSDKLTDNIVNNGEIQTNFPGKALPGVEFTAYDVTKMYEELRTKGETADEAFETLKKPETTGLTTYDFAATAENGKSSLDLPVSSTVDGNVRNAVYLIKETKAPSSVVKADNIVIALPFYQTDTTTRLDEVNLYPKNYQIKQTLSFTKYGVDSQGEKAKALEGAKFVLKNSDNNYLKAAPKTSGLPDFSGKLTDEVELRIFSSNKDGQVVASDLALETGKYVFEEVKSVGDYHLTKDAGQIVTVELNAEGKLTYSYFDAQGKPLTGQTEAKAYNYQVPNPVKTVNDNDADLDQVLTYTAELQIPTDVSSYTKFDLVDIPNENLELLTGLVTLKATVKDSDVTLTTIPTSEGKNGFRFAFFANEADKATLIANAGKTISIVFEMKIKEDAEIEGAIENELTFDNNFNTTTNIEKVVTSTYGKKFRKVDLHDEKITLEGAEFLVLRKGANGVEYRTYDKASKTYGWTTDKKDEAILVLTSSETGEFEIRGLATGGYQLEEIKAPTGYQLPAQPFFDFDVTETSYKDAAQVLAVPNSQNGILPSTGGKGIIGFLSIGILSLVSFVAYAIYRRRQLA